jgi:hypothetical protein
MVLRALSSGSSEQAILYSLLSGGKAIRNACGAITRRKASAPAALEFLDEAAKLMWWTGKMRPRSGGALYPGLSAPTALATIPTTVAFADFANA